MCEFIDKCDNSQRIANKHEKCNRENNFPDCLVVAEAPEKPRPSGSNESPGCADSVTQEMLNAAMRKGLEIGMVKRHGGEAQYLKNWENMKKVLEAAMRMR